MNSNTNNNTRDKLQKKMDIIDNQLSEENDKLRKISSAQDNLNALQNSIDECALLLFDSLDQGPAKNNFENLLTDNRENFNKAFNDFEKHLDLARKRVNDLKTERENIIEEYEKN